MGMNCLQCKNIFEEENNNEVLGERIAKQNEEKKLKSIHSLYNNNSNAYKKKMNQNSKSISYISGISAIEINNMSDMDISKNIFNKLNDFRLRTDFYATKAAEHGLEELFQYKKENENDVFKWSENKYNACVSREIYQKNKYKIETFVYPPFQIVVPGFDPEEKVWEILKQSSDEDRKKLLYKRYDSCVVNAKYENRMLYIEVLMLLKNDNINE